MKRRAWLSLPAALIAVGCHTPPSARAPSTILPLRTVRIYETGVGYFERSGTVSPGEGTSVPVPAAHIDDALKTLVVTGPGGVVHGLEFSSSVSKGMAKALGGLPLSAEGSIEYKDVIAGLKGMPIEVRTAKEIVAGRLVDVSEKAAPEPAAEESEGKKAGPRQPAPPVLTLLVLTTRGEIRTFRAEEVVAVRPTDPVVSSRWAIALDALSARSAQTEKLLRVMAAAANVTLGYVAETPVWRTTWRMVMAEDGKTAVLQGWALLHNDTDENWSRVRVHLVNGRPDSFLYPLAAPRYTQRELLTPDDQLSTVPQLYDKSPDEIWGDNVEAHVAYGAMSGVHASYGSGYGGGLAAGRRSSSPSVRMGSSVVSGESNLLTVGNLAPTPQATGVEAGALFTYTLPEPVDLRAHGSALVPFTSQAIQARAITWVDGLTPRSAVVFTNTTRQTLPAGPLAGYADGGFSGEATLDRTKPGERKFLRFGDDLDLELNQSVQHASPDYRRVTFQGDAHVVSHFIDVSTHKVNLENRGGRERVVYLPVHVGRNAKIAGADEIDFEPDTNRPIAVFRVPARTRASRELVVEEAVTRAEPVDMVTVKSLETVAASSQLAEADRKVLTEAIARRKELDGVLQDQAKVAAEMEELGKDLDRLREHLKAAAGDKGGPGGANPFVQRILAAEDRLGTLRKKSQLLATDRGQRSDAVKTALRALGR